jgi:hypothetical protein
MKQFFKNLMARARKAARRRRVRPLVLQRRLTLERLEERVTPSCLFLSGPCFPTGPCR